MASMNPEEICALNETNWIDPLTFSRVVLSNPRAAWKILMKYQLGCFVECAPNHPYKNILNDPIPTPVSVGIINGLLREEGLTSSSMHRSHLLECITSGRFRDANAYRVLADCPAGLVLVIAVRYIIDSGRYKLFNGSDFLQMLNNWIAAIGNDPAGPALWPLYYCHSRLGPDSEDIKNYVMHHITRPAEVMTRSDFIIECLVENLANGDFMKTLSNLNSIFSKTNEVFSPAIPSPTTTPSRQVAEPITVVDNLDAQARSHLAKVWVKKRTPRNDPRTNRFMDVPMELREQFQKRASQKLLSPKSQFIADWEHHG